MSKFIKYMHIERIDTEAVDGLLNGICHIFYKIDGTNGSIWFDERVRTASRNRELDSVNYENDNAGFSKWVSEQENIKNFFENYPNLRLFGEWLVPHSLKTYREDSWRKFYVFDVMNGDQFLHYDDYQPLLQQHRIDYIPPLAIAKNPSGEQLLKMLDNSGQFLIKDGEGKGEGIVIKNYDFVNKFGQQIWGKMVTNEFKEKHHKEMGAPLINGTLLVEERIVEKFCTEAFIEKERAKIINEHGEWSSSLIPKLLGIAYYTLIQEEMWNILREYKNPKIDFKLLNSLVIRRIKELGKIS